MDLAQIGPNSKYLGQQKLDHYLSLGPYFRQINYEAFSYPS